MKRSPRPKPWLDGLCMAFGYHEEKSYYGPKVCYECLFTSVDRKASETIRSKGFEPDGIIPDGYGNDDGYYRSRIVGFHLDLPADIEIFEKLEMAPHLLISEMDLSPVVMIHKMRTLLLGTNVREITLEAIGSETTLDDDGTPYGEIPDDILRAFRDQGITKLTIRDSVLKRSTISRILERVPSITHMTISCITWAKDGDNNSLQISSDALKELILYALDLSSNQDGDGILFERIPNLQSLTLEKCQLSRLPNSLQISSESLEKLILCALDLSSNPEEDRILFERIPNLQSLTMEKCRLSRLPNSLRELNSLQELNVSHNNLTMLPTWIGALTALNVLDCGQNEQLRKLHKSIANMDKLLNLKLDGCKALMEPPLAVYDGGLSDIKQYYLDLEAGHFNQCHCTIAIIGNKMAGKTSFVQTLQQREDCRTNRTNEADETTKVFNFESVVIERNFESVVIERERQIVQAKFIDFGGDKIYHHAYQLTFRHDCIQIFVVKITEFDEQSKSYGPREATRQLLARWVAQMYLAEPDMDPPLLVLTHKDQVEETDRSFKELKKELLEHYTVIMEESHVFKKRGSNVVRFDKVFAISYENGSEVSEWLKSIMDYLYQRIELYNVCLPKSWATEFNDMKEKKRHLISYGKDVEESERKHAVLNYHKRSGDILWYPDNSLIGDIIFHDIKMVTEIIALFFHHKESVAKLPIGKNPKPQTEEIQSSKPKWRGKQSRGILPARLALDMVKYALSTGSDEKKNEDVEDNVESGEAEKNCDELTQYALSTGSDEKKNEDVEDNVESGEEEKNCDELTQNAKIFVALLKSFKLIHGPAPHNGFECYVVPYFMDPVGPPTHSGEVSLGVDVNVLELGVPDYAYQQLTVAFLWENSDKYQVFAYGNGASAKTVNSDIHLYHDADSQRIHLRVESDAKHLDQAVKSLGALVKLVNMEMGQTANMQYDVLCVHCLTLNQLNPAVQHDTKFLEKYARHHKGTTSYGSVDKSSSVARLFKCPVVELTDVAGLIQAVKECRVGDDMDDIIEDMERKSPLIRNYPTLQTEMYRPVMREKIYAMTQTRGRALIINNKAKRKGSQKDYKRIEKMLKNFGFVISKLSGSREWPMEAIFRAIRKETMYLDCDTGQSVHKGLGMFVLVLMAHGNIGSIKGSDETAMPLLDIYKLLSAKNFPAMAGKPKLLIFQLCSGVGQEELTGRTTSKPLKYEATSEGAAKMDSPPPSPPPIEISSSSHVEFDKDINGHLTVDDLLLLRSSFDHFASKRDKSGSKFIKALIPVFNKYAHCEDLPKLGERIQRCATEKSKEQMAAAAAAAAAQLPESPEGVDTKSPGMVPISICTFTKGRKLYLSPGINMKTDGYHDKAFTSPILPKTITMPTLTIQELPSDQQGQNQDAPGGQQVRKRQKLVVDWTKMTEERT